MEISSCATNLTEVVTAVLIRMGRIADYLTLHEAYCSENHFQVIIYTHEYEVI